MHGWEVGKTASTEKGRRMTGENRRHLNLEGTYNVRDIGGYATTDGRSTRWRTFLRADNLHRLTPASQAALVEYGVRTVIDLRLAEETQAVPNVFADSSDVVYLHQDAYGGEPITFDNALVESEETAMRIVAGYTAALDQRQSEVSRTLITLAAPGTLPALVHCVGGQDRTGRIAALVLSIVGVPRETIAEDYALSARYLVKRHLDMYPEKSAADYTWQHYQDEFCSPDVMLKTLEHLDKQYGGVEGYVRAIGLTTEQIGRLRDALVE